jgi:putative colanic acid biosynthesis acetyltransferase WcaF
MSLDISSNRSAQKYTAVEQVRRLLWGCGKLLFCFSPRSFFGWRRFVLRCFGAKVGRHVHVYNSVRIYFPWNFAIGDWSAVGEGAFIYDLGKVTVGEKVTISHRAHICAGTHDYTKADLPLLKPPITIKDEAWICADAFVGPGVTVGEGAVVGARAVLTKDVEPWAIVAGNPARFLKKRELR